ncbi:MAG TPA: hypothetical protein VFX77_12245 [Rubrobacter sp.]|nr:hypothetical protein [Rubrobacter sp.]
MPDTPILILRFPDGQVEWRSSAGELSVGTLVRARGALWRVRQSDGKTVVLDEAPPEDQAKHGPTMKPSPLGDEPFLLETIIEI